MKQNDEFLLNVLNRFATIGLIEERDRLEVRKVIFSCGNFLEYVLLDRYLLLKDHIVKKVIDMFLIYLWNFECDLLIDKYIIATYQGVCGNLMTIMKMVINSLSHTKIITKGILEKTINKINIIRQIGYEHYFFNLYDCLVMNLQKERRFSFDEILSIYGKNENNLIKTDLDVCTSNIINTLKEIYHSASSRLQSLLFLNFINDDVVVKKVNRHLALVENNKIYLDSSICNKPLDVLKFVMLHESAHKIFNFEKRYECFEDVFIKQYSRKSLIEAWHHSKETTINFNIIFSNRLNFESTIYDFESNNFGHISMDSALLRLQSEKAKEGGFKWK